MKTLRVDLHTHCQGDPVDRLTHSVREHIDLCANRGVDAVAITWHTKIFDQPRWIEYAAERDILLIPGVEINLMGRHTLVLNVEPGDIPGNATLDQLRKLRKRKGNDILVIAPHPYYLLPSCLGKILDRFPELFDAVEWCHLHCDSLPSWLSPNERARRWAARYGKPVIQTSDAHVPRCVGRWTSTVEVEGATVEGLFEGIRSGRVSFEPESERLGTVAKKCGRVAWDMVSGLVGAGPLGRQKALAAQSHHDFHLGAAEEEQSNAAK